MTPVPLRRSLLYPLLAAGLLLAGCGTVDGLLGEAPPSDPAEAQIARFTGQGFTLVSDGRSSGGPSALRYQGSPDGVIACAPSGGSPTPTDQAGNATTADGRYTVIQSGHVAAYVIVTPEGGLRGLYVNDLLRRVTTSDGTLVARQLETIEFPPGGSGRFSGGLTCRPA